MRSLSETVFNKFEMSIVLLLHLFIRVVWIDGDEVVNEAVDGVGYFLGGHVCIAAAGRFLRLLAFSEASLSRSACKRRGKGDLSPACRVDIYETRHWHARWRGKVGCIEFGWGYQRQAPTREIGGDTRYRYLYR